MKKAVVLPEVSYTYALLDTRKPGPYRYGRFIFEYEPFYVGKGKGLRCVQHLDAAMSGVNTHKNNKILSILRNGGEVKLRIFKSDLSDASAIALEIKLIAQIGRGKEGPLINKTDGGDGGAGYKFSKSDCKKRSEAMKARGPELSARMLKLHADRTLEERAAIRTKIADSVAAMDPKRRRKINAHTSKVVLLWHSGFSKAEKRNWVQSLKDGWAALPTSYRDELKSAVSSTLKTFWSEMPTKEKTRRTKHLRCISASSEAKRVQGIVSSWWARTPEERAEINARRNASIRATRALSKIDALKLHTAKERFI